MTYDQLHDTEWKLVVKYHADWHIHTFNSTTSKCMNVPSKCCHTQLFVTRNTNNTKDMQQINVVNSLVYNRHATDAES